jgi:uncharacterized protein (TIGR03086 family)
MTDPAAPTVLDTTLDQLRGLIAGVGPDDLARPVPCEGWTVTDLVGHVLHTVGNFGRAARGDAVDWAAPAPPMPADFPAAFDTAAAELRAAWAKSPESVSPDMLCAELGVHTWDLARGLGVDTAAFDPAVAERGLAMLQANLTADNRGDAFKPEQPAPDDADAYTRIAAFAGRRA